MAKTLKLVGMKAVAGGLVFELERLGERFEMPLRHEGLPALLDLIGRGTQAGGLIVSRNIKSMAFAPRDDAPGITLALELVDWPLMAVELDWAEVHGLSELATAALEHAPKTDRPN